MSNPDKDSFDTSELDASLPAAAAALSAEDRAGLVNALKNKLQDLAEQHVDVMESLPPRVRTRVEALKSIQSQHDELEAKYIEERTALEAKYQILYEPFYTKRFEIVNGVAEVEGVAADTEANSRTFISVKGVPDFWLTAMKSNEILEEEITERDEEALKYLKDIKWSRLDDPKGFKLEFFFDTNPFFKNSVLRKTYHMIEEDEPILEKAIGTEIEWHPGKCLTQKVLKKKPKKGAKNAKPIIKTEKCESFFNFFNPPEVPDDDEDMDDDKAEELQNLMEQDYDIGSTIRDKIIPHAVSWFTGEAAEGDELILSDEDDEDDDDEEDEDEEEDEDDDEDDEEEKVEVKSRKKKGSRAPAGEGQPGERPPECKQQ
ncbi:Nucleosome assembly protein 1 [Salvia divinorum]|uniref:Nucleosome assembly protein 1 n=1 Tax=Salvia divinorum TaxID=28513 RepID=A0ABD1H5K4_SALDI